MRPIFLVLILFFSIYNSHSQSASNPLITKDAVHQQKWVDSIYASMSLKERVGQLYIVQVMSEQNEAEKTMLLT